MSRSYESPSRKAQADETRRSILRALVDLLVEEHPSTISVPRVAQKAEVSVRIVYHYFPSKDALFEGLQEAMPELLVPPRSQYEAASPRQLADALPTVFEYLEANAELFRAVRLSEWSDQLHRHRRAERTQRIDAALAPLADALDATDLRKLRGLIGTLTSFDGFDALTRTWGLTRDEAADAVAWTITLLSDRARRSGVAAR